MPNRPQELPERSFSFTQDGILDLPEPLQEQKSNLFFFNLSDQRFAFFPTSAPFFHPSISLSSQHSIAPWNAEPLNPRGRNVDQRSDNRQVSTREFLYTSSQQEGGLEHFKLHILPGIALSEGRFGFF